MLELKHVFYTAEEKDILLDVNLKIEDRFVAITGPNGSGKSTLLKVIMGLLTPTSGEVWLDGENLTGLSVDERARRGISFAFQQPVRFKGLRVRDLLELTGDGQTSRKDQFNHACEVLSQVGLCARDYLDRELNDTLSGGEMKRIEIATILARNTRLSVFDEPEAGIDLWSFQNLIHVFENMNRRTGGSILIISHQERILNIADRIIVLSGGRLEKQGTREEILPGLLRDTCSVLESKMRRDGE